MELQYHHPIVRTLCLQRGRGVAKCFLVCILVFYVLVQTLAGIPYRALQQLERNHAVETPLQPTIQETSEEEESESLDEGLEYPEDTTGTVFDDFPLEADVRRQRNLACYISMGQANNYKMIRDRMEEQFDEGTYAFFYHSWDEDCDGCIFQNRTYFHEGKNLVFKRLVNSDYWQHCKYLTHFDDDIKLSFSDGNITDDDAWGAYHRMLVAKETNHPLIRPNEKQFDGYQPTTSYQSSSDGQFQTFRFDHVSLLWPLSGLTPKDKWHNDQFFFLKVAKCFPAGFRADHRFISHNVAHRYDSSGFSDLSTNILKEKEALFDRSLPELAPWHFVDYQSQGHRSSVQAVPSVGWHEKCREAMDRHLALFLNDQPWEDLVSSQK